MNSLLVILPAGLLYAYLVISNPGSAIDFMAQLMPPTLTTTQATLGSATGATIAWVHIAALDLFIGRWVYLDSRALSISAWVVSPINVVVFLLGPLGLLL
jgi:hypothetical protein